MTLPDMNQEQFVQMWQTVYNLFVGHPDEQDFYHALACTGTELLQMGEMNHEAKTKSDNAAVEHSGGDSATYGEASRDSSATAATVSSDVWDRHWHISFQQFRACLHKDEHLASFFDTKTPVSSALEELRSSRILQRASSTPPLTGAIKVRHFLTLRELYQNKRRGRGALLSFKYRAAGGPPETIISATSVPVQYKPAGESSRSRPVGTHRERQCGSCLSASIAYLFPRPGTCIFRDSETPHGLKLYANMMAQSYQVTPGVLKTVIQPGIGPRPNVGDSITVHCTGLLTNPPRKFWSQCSKFCEVHVQKGSHNVLPCSASAVPQRRMAKRTHVSSLPTLFSAHSTRDPGQQPFSFRVGVGEVIRGWDEGCLSMQKHELSRLTICGLKAYGAQGFPAWGYPFFYSCVKSFSPNVSFPPSTDCVS
ncbi:hypothetical protein HPB51_024715 [Rhipicephalus microplus]|uniref:peptidylprolyl isomerase n=1 Tax=Rhipicephalus microplus TaxID=6941 RepID=A0A9J6EVP0_RHIMP|nr:hypothetical protein HPB51_024715 [Rhipicephalus microplus]